MKRTQWDPGLEAALERRGGRYLRRGQPGYPDLGALRDPPEILTLRGSLAGAGAGPVPPAVAVVGARRADPGALRIARAFGNGLARAGFTVVSGGALGIDAAAHEGALEAGGATVAVLGSGVLQPTPRQNRRLFARILEAGGGLCAELPPDAPACPWHFPVRNRLVVGLARAVVVIRAADGSGCAHTVDYARELRRPVFALAPEEPVPRNGLVEQLLRPGLFGERAAVPVRDVDELLCRLGAQRERAEPPGLEPRERQVLSALCDLPAPLGAIAAAARVEPAEAARMLASLCARGLARAAGPGRFAAGRSVGWDGG